MLSAAFKLIKLITGNETEPVTEHEASAAEEEAVPLTEPPCSPGSNEWHFTGKVTSVHGSYGMVDKQVYFSIKCLPGGGKMPPPGATVNVYAKRKHSQGGWMAEQISVLDIGSALETPAKCWYGITAADDHDDKGDSKSNAYFTGIVTSEDQNGGLIDERISYTLSSVDHPGYVPCRGDLVSAKQVMSDDQSFVVTAQEVKPLRVREFTGVINSTQFQSHGYIDSEIYFNWNACEDFAPKRHDRVCGEAVEVTRGQCQWRAFIVRKIPSNLDPSVANAANFKRELPLLLSDKGGLCVSNVEFGQVEIGVKRSIALRIRNECEEVRTLQKYYLQGDSSQFTVSAPWLEGVDFADPQNYGIISIPPGKCAVCRVECEAVNFGSEKRLLLLEFDDFTIGRQLSVEVRAADQHRLDPSTPYQRSKGASRYLSTQQGGQSWVVPGQRPTRSTQSMQLPVRLGQYPVPQSLRTWLDDDRDLEQLMPALAEPLTMKNYSRKFTSLLHLEEIQQDIEMREFDMERVCLRPVGEYLCLQVPGLAEGRPSLLLGDKVLLSTPHVGQHGPVYEGFIHEVQRDDILLKFHNEFHSKYSGQDYHVQFSFNRTTLRRCHSATEQAINLGAHVLFPENITPKAPQVPRFSQQRKVPGGSMSASTLTFHNKLLNARQRAAVLRILDGQSRPTPYILFGPPGTGKTVTVVEAILQVFQHVPYSRIMACAPSNSAADLLAERLHMSGLVNKSDMVRLNAFQRIEEHIPEAVKGYSSDGDDLQRVSRFRVIVCTCTTAGMLYSLGLRRGHFTHAFVDEAGQATEPEAMIPAGLVTGGSGQIVLAGDPMQLGPVLRSNYAKHYGLQQSWLERLSLRPAYTRDEKSFAAEGSYNPLLVTKLVENYRSHPAILTVPSHLFYHDELHVKADPDLIQKFCDWDQLVNKDNFPVIFHGIRGQDLREGSSPSWFNPVEALQVMRYLQALTADTKHMVGWDDIGVITPYRKQVEKIRLLIDKLGMEKVKVGSVEEFQGQERLVIIISTVRSNDTEVQSDVIHNLGFLSNPKRFNVSITRAQALLIVVGNPHVLAKDIFWRTLIHYCASNHAYTGCDIPLEISGLEIPAVTEEVPSQSSGDGPVLTGTAGTAQKTAEEPPVADRDVSSGDVETDDGSARLEQEAIPDHVPAVQKENLSDLSIPVDDNKRNSLTNTCASLTQENSEQQTILEPTQSTPSENLKGISFEEEDPSITPLQAVEPSMKHTDIPMLDSVESTKVPECKSDNSIEPPCSNILSDVQSKSEEAGSTSQSSFGPECSIAAGDNIPLHHPQSPDAVAEGQRSKTHPLCKSLSIETPNKIHEDCTGRRVAKSENRFTPYKKSPSPTSKQGKAWFKPGFEVRKHTNGSKTSRTIVSPSKEVCSGSCIDCLEKPSVETPVMSAPPTSTAEVLVKSDTLKGTITSTKDKGGDGDHVSMPENIGADQNGDSSETQKCKAYSLDASADEFVPNTQTSYSDSAGYVKQIDSAKSTQSATELKNENEPCSTRTEACVMPVKDIPSADIIGKSVEPTISPCANSQTTETQVAATASKSSREHDVSQSKPDDLLESLEEKLVLLDKTKQSLDALRQAGEVPVVNMFTTPDMAPSQSETLGEAQLGAESSVPATDLEKKIIRQIEYYFGDLNLLRDKFLMENIAKDPEQYVPISLILTFNRMKRFMTNISQVACALRKSENGLVEVSCDGLRVRRSYSRPLPTDFDAWKLDLKARSVAVEGLAVNLELDEVQDLMEQIGSVEHVERCIHKRGAGNRRLAYADFIVFTKQSSAETAAREGGMTFRNRHLRFYYRDKVSSICMDQFYLKRVIRPLNLKGQGRGQGHNRGQGYNRGSGRGQGQRRDPNHREPDVDRYSGGYDQHEGQGDNFQASDNRQGYRTLPRDDGMMRGQGQGHWRVARGGRGTVQRRQSDNASDGSESHEQMKSPVSFILPEMSWEKPCVVKTKTHKKKTSTKEVVSDGGEATRSSMFDGPNIVCHTPRDSDASQVDTVGMIASVEKSQHAQENASSHESPPSNIGKTGSLPRGKAPGSYPHKTRGVTSPNAGDMPDSKAVRRSERDLAHSDQHGQLGSPTSETLQSGSAQRSSPGSQTQAPASGTPPSFTPISRRGIGRGYGTPRGSSPNVVSDLNQTALKTPDRSKFEEEVIKSITKVSPPGVKVEKPLDSPEDDKLVETFFSKISTSKQGLMSPERRETETLLPVTTTRHRSPVVQMTPLGATSRNRPDVNAGIDDSVLSDVLQGSVALDDVPRSHGDDDLHLADAVSAGIHGFSPSKKPAQTVQISGTSWSHSPQIKSRESATMEMETESGGEYTSCSSDEDELVEDQGVLYESLDQRDSDVIIESSEEEIVEDS